ncbi:MAG: glucan biosynthesis protein D, partial [Rhodomicrobium sp.]|nr:glucan biosynthesis protein D [Rhodomicrobium sp.]
MIDRRTMLIGSAALGLMGVKASAEPPNGIVFGPEVPFSFEALTGWARDLSRQPYQKPVVHDPELLERLDFDAYQQIKFRPDWAIWLNGDGPYPIELFHVGRYFKEPVRIFAVSASGKAKEVRYSPDLFTFGKSTFAKSLPADTGFAGFRVLTAPGEPDWLAFIGASYFRSPGETRQYGLSSRGLAIDVAMPTPEEFPRFSSFWLEPLADKPGIVINALLDSPSITGAYRMETSRESGTLMNIQARLFPRTDMKRVGVAPLTSMFWYSKHNRRMALDWRPEIHDSDGLAIWTGAGERMWRPINNPLGVQTSSFFDINPKGFGLLQRERRFSEYEDDGAFYDRRPSVWVETIGDWGEGAVQLVEIPTNDEIHDNIVAYWTPKEPYRAGGQYEMRYKLHWRLDEPYPAPLARVVATRMGLGGIPGQPRPKGVVKFVVDFRGGKLSQFSRRDDIDLAVSVPSGHIERKAIYPVVDTDKWRAIFDF